MKHLVSLDFLFWNVPDLDRIACRFLCFAALLGCLRRRSRSCGYVAGCPKVSACLKDTAKNTTKMARVKMEIFIHVVTDEEKTKISCDRRKDLSFRRCPRHRGRLPARHPTPRRKPPQKKPQARAGKERR